MKKKSLAVIMLASALAIQSFAAYGASSPSYDDNEPSYEEPVKEEKADNEVVVNKDGVKTTGATTDTSSKGISVGVVVDATTPSGQTITVNERGEAVVGNVAIGFAKGAGATAGLPADVVSTINDINAGKTLSDVVKGVDLTGFSALTGTHALLTKEAATGALKDTPTEAAIYVPNAVGDLSDLSVLYYDNATSTWKVLPVIKFDPATKVIYVNVPGSGTFTVIHKNK